ncbi:MAG: GTP-binding protein, partial [Candidatus Adiutricales bacterium]
MKDIDQILNIAFISHGGAGKTSLAEAFLYLTGVTNRLGSVDEATSNLDFEPEEVKRQTSLSSAFHHYPWKKKTISFIDTPGDENFINDTKTCLQGVDGAVVLVDAVDGVKVGTERVWEFAEDRELARVVFVNKMDRERADFFKVVNELSEAFELKCVPVNVPLGSEHDFKGIVNLLDEKAYIYEEGTGKFNQAEVPEDLTETVENWREQLIENIAETDDDL